jgi:predicted HTH domain antitoxin
MEESFTLHVPYDWIEDIPAEEITLKQVFRMGIFEYKIKRAIQLYKEGIGSLGFIAEKLGIPKRDLIREFRQRRIQPEFSESTVYEEQ